MALLGALVATTTASPAPVPPVALAPITEVTPTILELEPRAEDVDHTAIVNTYSGDTCNGDNSQFTVAGAGASVCHVVTFVVRSIQVSAKYVYSCSIIFICPFFYLF